MKTKNGSQNKGLKVSVYSLLIIAVSVAISLFIVNYYAQIYLKYFDSQAMIEWAIDSSNHDYADTDVDAGSSSQNIVDAKIKFPYTKTQNRLKFRLVESDLDQSSPLNNNINYISLSPSSFEFRFSPKDNNYSNDDIQVVYHNDYTPCERFYVIVLNQKDGSTSLVTLLKEYNWLGSKNLADGRNVTIYKLKKSDCQNFTSSSFQSDDIARFDAVIKQVNSY